MKQTNSIIPKTDLDLIQVIETLPDAVMLIDVDFTVRLVNAAFENLLGVRRQAVLGKKENSTGAPTDTSLSGVRKEKNCFFSFL